MTSLEPQISDSVLETSIPTDGNPHEQVRILIVDDQHFVRKMLEHSLSVQGDFEIIGMASNGKDALEQVRRYLPQIVLIDIEMPDIDGLTVTRTLVEQYPDTKVLVLSIHDDEDYIRQALEVGARGYLLKTTPAEELAHAIRFVHRGYLQLGPGLFEKLETPVAQSKSLSVDAIPAPVPMSAEAQTLEEMEQLAIASEDSSLEQWTDVTQDLVNTLPQAWSRGLVYVFLVFIIGIIPWSFLTKVDEVVVTKGILEPKGQTIRLDAPVEAKVINIFVKEGHEVKQGDPIIEFQSDQVKAELQQAEARLTGQLNQLSQQELLKNQILGSINFQNLQNEAQSVEKQAQVTQAEQVLDASEIRMPIQLSEKAAQVDQAIAALDAAQRKVTLLQENYQAELAEVKRYQTLLEQGAIPSIQLVEAQRRASDVRRLKSDAEAEVSLAQRRLQEQRRSYDNLKSQLSAEQQQAQTRVIEQHGGKVTLHHTGKLAISQTKEQLSDAESRITELKSQINQTKSQIENLRAQQKQSIMYAPTQGTVFKLPIQHPGAVVRPTQPVAEIAPTSAKLVLRGAVENKDIGFLKVGLPVQLKFDAFPYENFGLIPGKVTWLSPNSAPVPDPGAKSVEGLPAANSAFTVEVSLDQESVLAQDQEIQFKPGQTASAEIAVRQRRVIDLFLDPFLKYQKGNPSI